MFATVNHCDHCNTDRQRRDTYVVHKNGEGYKQVGSSCIRDFTGHDPAAIVGWLDSVGHLQFGAEEIMAWAATATRFYSPTEVLGIAARVVAKAGYVNKQTAEEQNRESTGGIVRDWLSANPTRIRELNNRYPNTTEAIALYHVARQAIFLAPTDNDWVRDVQQLFAASGIQWRHVGILASGVILGLRQQERKAYEAKSPSHFIPGAIGDRIDIPVKVTMKRSFEGSYGERFLIRMDNNGDDVIWWASWSETTANIKEGDEFIIRGTIKSQELDRRTERPTTELTRCQIREV